MFLCLRAFDGEERNYIVVVSDDRSLDFLIALPKSNIVANDKFV